MEYQKTHPWLTFKMDLRSLPPTAWIQLGEIVSKAKHVANAPIDPFHAQEMYDIFLAKGAAATTAIEGNTLSEEDVLKQINGDLELPVSQEYLQIETQNIVDACNQFVADLSDATSPDCKITVDFIKALNAKALAGLDLEDGVVAGEVRRHSVVVSNYRGAPNDECYYLLERMCETVEGMLCTEDDDARYQNAIFAALFSHVYIALIHPFGDGNGRTSRLLEVYLLLRAGFPMPTCQLLSNHYNKTRTAYYKNLDAISKRDGLIDFISYALQGFTDGIRDQVDSIQKEQVRVTWVNFVHQRFSEKTTDAAKRQRNLALSISRDPLPRTIESVLDSDSRLNRAYAPLAQKTLTRDVNVLLEMGLIQKTNKGRYRPALERITSFLPWRNDPVESEQLLS